MYIYMQADILVSELLGSFGDNELSPECLDGAQSFLKRKSSTYIATYALYVYSVHTIYIVYRHVVTAAVHYTCMHACHIQYTVTSMN